MDTFAKVAERESEHSATQGRGGLTKEAMSLEKLKVWPYGPAVAAAAFSLEKHKTSDILEVDGGFWIVAVDQKLAAEEKSLEEAQNGIAKQQLQSTTVTLLTQNH